MGDKGNTIVVKGIPRKDTIWEISALQMKKYASKGCKFFVVYLMDDILIYSKNKQEHEEHLKIIIQVFREQQLFAKFSKCNFFKYKI